MVKNVFTKFQEGKSCMDRSPLRFGAFSLKLEASVQERWQFGWSYLFFSVLSHSSAAGQCEETSLKDVEHKKKCKKGQEMINEAHGEERLEEWWRLKVRLKEVGRRGWKRKNAGGKGEEARHNGDIRGRDNGKVEGRLKEVETGRDKRDGRDAGEIEVGGDGGDVGRGELQNIKVKRLEMMDEMQEE
ncbi:hypothetical protein DNTS_032214 [Danionella cerebrum]|uniref:Uncharacterized protein n=1 Tax=Danionella cerebrum TaxID=2873325 RepID=A0A553N5R0_9TELE|nr:hypothetical protein DNTS_032214 [Danionella translucida]